MNNHSFIAASPLRRVLLALACGLLFAAAQQVVGAALEPAPWAGASQAGLEDWKVWNFDNATDLGQWNRRTGSGSPAYLWAEDTYTSTTGAQSVRPLGDLLTATASLPYPGNLDTWMIYSFTVPADLWGTRLAFDWWLDSAPGDALTVLGSTDGIHYTTQWTQTGRLGSWHTDQVVSLSPKGYSGRYYVALRFQSDDDGQAGLGAFVDHVRLQYNHGFFNYLPLMLKQWSPPPPAAPVLNPIANDDGDGNYDVTWNAAERAAVYILQEDEDPDFGSPETFAATTALLQAIGGKAVGVYYYRVKGASALSGGEEGPWSNVVSATVTMVLDAPHLNKISNPLQLAFYIVSWEPVAAAESYVLEEASASTFISATVIYTGTQPQYIVSGRGPGVHYYRVKAVKPPISSGWSNVESTEIASYNFKDDFNDPSTGWKSRRTSAPEMSVFPTYYYAGLLRMELMDKFDFGIASPMRIAPPPPYSIRMMSRAVYHGNLTGYGIIFGGTGGTCPVDRSNSGDPNGCFFKYYRLSVIYHGGGLRYAVHRIDSHSGGEDGRGHASSTALTGYQELADEDSWHTWEIKVYPDGFEVYADGHKKYWVSDSRYVYNPYYGIFITTDEYNHSFWEHDYYYVESIPPKETMGQ